MSSHVLSDRDVNTASVSGMPTDANGKASGAQAHRNALQSRMGEDKSKQTYVSPSDGLMSPCTAKLSALKHKHFMNANSKPKSLFAKPEAATSPSQSTSSNDPLGVDVSVDSQENAQESQDSRF